MAQAAFDEKEIRLLPAEKRLEKLESTLKISSDESERWDAVWMTGEIAADAGEGAHLYNKVADLFSWILKNDNNSIVRHEVFYQIAGRNMMHKVPDLIESGLHDQSALVRHEAIECLSIIHAHDKDTLAAFEEATKDPNESVRETADFVLKRVYRTKRRLFEPDTSAY